MLRYYTRLRRIPLLGPGLWNYTILLSIKNSGREVQPLTALYPIVRPSPWRHVRKNIHSRVRSPVLLDLYSTQEGHPSWFPFPRRLIRTLVQGDYPQYHSILSPPRRASLLVPLPLELSDCPPPEFCPLLLCVLCVYLACRTFMHNHHQLESLLTSNFSLQSHNLTSG